MKKVVMYFKIPCAYCTAAKRFLESKGIPFDEIDLTDKPEEMQRIKDEVGWKTVPIIMINGQLIGGYTDLKALDAEGKLDALMAGS